MIGGAVGSKLLRGHVRRCADCHASRRAGCRGNCGGQCLRHTEVGNQGVHSRREDVVGLDVTMDDAAGVLVGDGIHDIVEDAHYATESEPPGLHEGALE